MPYKLNDLTKEEIEKFKAKRETRECANCGKPVAMRRDQHFCNARCRAAYAAAAARALQERLFYERDQLQKERLVLIKEIQELREELERIKKQ